ncbi:hypothetical protein GE061_017466 [Apolygus lucorum]|uniref:Uncharacterized protein n=1 Tax=Apolygus lucorum TaxID=248454 RepID=A0A8S9XB59_APOLU|nr:hypothetical protein GE061_017466 [Apolygus lucorum]
MEQSISHTRLLYLAKGTWFGLRVSLTEKIPVRLDLPKGRSEFRAARAEWPQWEEKQLTQKTEREEKEHPIRYDGQVRVRTYVSMDRVVMIDEHALHDITQWLASPMVGLTNGGRKSLGFYEPMMSEGADRSWPTR